MKYLALVFTLALVLLLTFFSIGCESQRIDSGLRCAVQCEGVDMRLVEIQIRDTSAASGVICICR